MALSVGAMWVVCLALYLLTEVYAYQSFQMYIPNGDRVKGANGEPWGAVGHPDPRGGWAAGEKNVFGTDFYNAGLTWTKALCEKDSDRDGQTNGYELGDPDCDWSMGKTPRRIVNISHPGQAASTTPLYPLHYGDTVVFKCKLSGKFVGSNDDDNGLLRGGKERPMAMHFRLESREDNMTGQNITSGSEIFLYSWSSQKRVSVQNSTDTVPGEWPGVVHNHWNHTGTWEVFTIEKYLGGTIYDDDQVSFRAHTGSLLMVDENSYITANTSGWQQSMNFFLEAVVFEE
mmetsp:Transcript_87411/g.182922  ORF Transcript_87411/g.182922 Transcript_87411/m.182922 type:complete len:287 (+) Transcript_87411:191-1051(+)